MRRDERVVSAITGRRAAPDVPAASDEVVASPCISVCVMDGGSGLCIGCYRTLDEIAAWSVLDATARRGVLAALPARRQPRRATEGER